MSDQNLFAPSKRDSLKAGWTLLLFVLAALPLMSHGSDIPSFGDPYLGQQLFETKGCMSCHKVFNQGGSGGPDLGEKNYDGTFLSLAAVMWNHSPKMVKMVREKGLVLDEMSKQEVSQIISYLSFLRFRNNKGNIFVGRKLLEKKGCLNCHNSDNEKQIATDFTEIKYYITPLYLTQQMWNHGPDILKAEVAKGIKHIQLNGDEIQHISAALKDLSQTKTVKTEFSSIGKVSKGKELFQSKGCASCHQSPAEGSKIPDLLHMSEPLGIMEIASAMWNHGPDMWRTMDQQGVEHPTFEGSDMADLISYLFFEQAMTADGNPDQGRTVFEKKSCAKCHVKNGEAEGNKLALPAIHTPLDMVEAMWNHIAGMQERMKVEKIEFPELEEQEMIDLYSFLSAEEKK